VIAGNTYTLSYDPASLTANQTVDWTWDGQAALG
jgi:hypothetical protein